MLRVLKVSWALLLPFAVLSACKPAGEHGAGSVGNHISPQSYQCEPADSGGRLQSAGVVHPEVPSCEGLVRPSARQPQMLPPASRKPVMAHRWWGNVTFFGAHAIGDAEGIGHITPDPIMARITERGARIMGIPVGLEVQEDGVTYPVPEPLEEVYDGIALANSLYADLDAFVRDYSDASVTVEWRDGHRPVMAATFVQGLPYVYLSVYRGELVLRTHAPQGDRAGIFHEEDDALGLWADVAGQRNHFLVSGQGAIRHERLSERDLQISSQTSHFTLTWLPAGESAPSSAMIADFLQYAHQPVDQVRVDYQVDPADFSVMITHQYLYQNRPVKTMVGLQPLHWKNSEQALTHYQVRSSRGMLRFAETQGFRYHLPFVGVLPGLPAGLGEYDSETLARLIREFVAKGRLSWDTRSDTYWAGKQYGKVAELALLARTHGLEKEADQLIGDLKLALEDWFTAGEGVEGKPARYFIYDKRWNTLLGVHESFGSHQALNDHHFHYGYFVRAAAEICRVDPAWCSQERWGSMVEMLIRDYAAGRDDPEFPYLRHFDPAFGFSWASGSANYLLGNNNESTSEAANAYGAMILYGLVTDQPELVDRGVYLHSSSTATFWEYWNDIDGFHEKSAEYRNFPESYGKLTTSIIWGSGHVLTTWFSDALAHILGIQGLPVNGLVLYLGQYPDYLQEYVALGLSETGNGKPSGLPDNQWRDIWWSIWAMTDAKSALADMLSYGMDYTPEEGETLAHTYHWVHTWQALGHLLSGGGTLTADYPAAVAFSNGAQRTYVAYNFDQQERDVVFSDGVRLTVAPGRFEVRQLPENPR